MKLWQFSICAALLLALVVLTALPLVSPNRAAPRWEYRIEAVEDLKFEATMKERGEAGWELVFARRARDADREEMAYEMIFKRPR